MHLGATVGHTNGCADDMPQKLAVMLLQAAQVVGTDGGNNDTVCLYTALIGGQYSGHPSEVMTYGAPTNAERTLPVAKGYAASDLQNFWVDVWTSVCPVMQAARNGGGH